MSAPRDRGFALIAVLFACAALAGVAYDLVLQNRTAIVEAQAQIDRAHLENAANSAIALAVQGLSGPDAAARWPIDGSTRQIDVDGMAVTLAIEDERGKIPLNVLSETEARRMFAAAGARGPALDTVTDSFLDWRDDDDERRPFGAESEDYAAAGYRARNGDVTALGELARIRGMTPGLYAALLPVVTLWFGESGGFSEATARPLAVAVMTGPDVADGPDVVQVRTDQAVVRPKFKPPTEEDAVLRGRRLTIRVVARDARGGELHRAHVIEFTGNPANPLWVRAAD